MTKHAKLDRYLLISSKMQIYLFASLMIMTMTMIIVMTMTVMDSRIDVDNQSCDGDTPNHHHDEHCKMFKDFLALVGPVFVICQDLRGEYCEVDASTAATTTTILDLHMSGVFGLAYPHFSFFLQNIEPVLRWFVVLYFGK